MTQPLVLSLFPGIGLLDRAFEEEGFCVVRGPDLLWGGDVKTFHPPAGKFDGVIGGPPCQAHSRFVKVAEATGKIAAPDLIPEFERIVAASEPEWFLMENVEDSPKPYAPDYNIYRFLLQNRDIPDEDGIGAEQNRVRAFSYGHRRPYAQDLRVFIEPAVLQNPQWCAAILASGGRRPGKERARGKTLGKWHGWTTPSAYAFALKAQGLPADFLADAPFTAEGRFRVIGNGVPLPMGRAIAKAVKQAMGYALEATA